MDTPHGSPSHTVTFYFNKIYLWLSKVLLFTAVTRGLEKVYTGLRLHKMFSGFRNLQLWLNVDERQNREYPCLCGWPLDANAMTAYYSTGLSMRSCVCTWIIRAIRSQILAVLPLFFAKRKCSFCFFWSFGPVQWLAQSPHGKRLDCSGCSFEWSLPPVSAWPLSKCSSVLPQS